jgi:hypothetical protein
MLMKSITTLGLALMMIVLLLVAFVIWDTIKEKRCKKQVKKDSGSYQLTETIKVPKPYDYAEDPDTEEECGDSMPLDDAEGLFDTSRSPSDKLKLIDIMSREGLKVNKRR